jgi:hypothetical protein
MFNGTRQPSCGGTSRMTRECQVRFCEGLGMNSPGLLDNCSQKSDVEAPAQDQGRWPAQAHAPGDGPIGSRDALNAPILSRLHAVGLVSPSDPVQENS